MKVRAHVDVEIGDVQLALAHVFDDVTSARSRQHWVQTTEGDKDVVLDVLPTAEVLLLEISSDSKRAWIDDVHLDVLASAPE